MDDMDLVVWSEKEWCRWEHLASYGRNRTFSYQILKVGSPEYKAFLEKIGHKELVH